jgi:DNA mismatch repair protein MutS2
VSISDVRIVAGDAGGGSLSQSRASKRSARSERSGSDRGDRQPATPAGSGASESGGERAYARTPDATLDVRGERVDEAIDSVDRFIDRSLLATREVIFVIHGHGTGALRSALRAHLSGHPCVTQVRPGERADGGDGVTVAWIDAT